MSFEFALCGNPNVGKTSLYNRITRSLEHVGNWHGVTVSSISKEFLYEGKKLLMTDLPGLYSLTVYSPEEAISRDYILNNKSDIVINVCEVNNLKRNLYLTLQLLEYNVKTVLVINMMDELKKQKKELDYSKLQKHLNIPIVPMSAKYRTDTGLLTDTCLKHLKAAAITPDLKYLKKLPLNEVEKIINQNAKKAGIPVQWAAIKVLEKDNYIIHELNLNKSQQELITKLGDWQSNVAKARFEFIDEITAGIITKKGADKQSSQSDVHGFSRIDKILLNKYFALPIFFLIMASVFIVTFGIIGPIFSDLLQLGIQKAVYKPLNYWLKTINSPAWITALIGDGVVLGALGILAFLPQVVFLFFFLALLEDSGYISRVAFMTDGFFSKIGLSGRSVFTMLMGFGCAATAVLTARALEDETMRKKTILLTPFMSCSARLPVYTVIGAAFFRLNPLLIFLLYILGICIAITIAALLERFKRFKSGKQYFIMEIPPYRLPTLERVSQIIWHNVKAFLIRIGSLVFALNIIVWILSNFSFSAGYILNGEKSILQTLSGYIAPIFKPLGFGNWQAVTALLSGFVAKEAVISSINSLGGVDMIFTFSSNSLNVLSAFCFLVFVLLYVPCIATLISIAKEIGVKWAVFSLLLQMFIAYSVTLIVRGFGLVIIDYHPAKYILTALGFLIIALIILSSYCKRQGLSKKRSELLKGRLFER